MWDAPLEFVIGRASSETKRIWLYNDSTRTIQLRPDIQTPEKFVLTLPETIIAPPGASFIDIGLTGSSSTLPWAEDFVLQFVSEDYETGSGFFGQDYTEWAYAFDPNARQGAGGDILRFEVSAFILPVADERFDPDKPTHLTDRFTFRDYIISGMGSWPNDSEAELDLISDLLYEPAVWAVNKHYANDPLHGPIRFASSRAEALGYSPPGIGQFPPKVRRRVLANAFSAVRNLSTIEGLKSAFAALGVDPTNMTVEHDSLNFTWKIRLPFYALGIFNIEYLGQYALYHVDAYNIVDIGIVETSDSFIYTEIDYMVPPVIGILPPTEGRLNGLLSGLTGTIIGENIGSPVSFELQILTPEDGAVFIDEPHLSVIIDQPLNGSTIIDAGDELVTYTLPPEDTVAFITNPDIGWHGTVNDPGAFGAVRGSGQSITRWLVRLDAYRDTPVLPESFLDEFRGVLEAAETAGIKLILRHVYNYQELPRLDAPLPIMLGHIEQLGVIWHEYERVISSIQMGFIGEWGELHSSSNGIDANVSQRNQVFAAVLNNSPDSIMVNVRYPDMVQEYLGHSNPLNAEQRFNETHAARLGLLNDSFLANYTDGGTYIESRYPPDYDTNLAIKAYWAAYSPYVSATGETVDLPWQDGNREFGPQAMAEMAQLNWDSLNRDYSERVINNWIAGGYYNDITRSLGYRLVLHDVTTAANAEPGASLPITFRMSNVGWGKVFNPRPIDLIFRAGNGDEYTTRLTDDARRLLPLGGTSTQMSFMAAIPDEIPAGNYSVYMRMPDPDEAVEDRPQYAIQLANSGTWRASDGAHNLGFAVTIGEPGLQVEITSPTNGAVIYEYDSLAVDILAPASGSTFIDWELQLEILEPENGAVIVVDPSYDLLIFG